MQVEKRMQELSDRLRLSLGNWDHAKLAVEWLIKDYRIDLDCLKVRMDMMVLEKLARDAGINLPRSSVTTPSSLSSASTAASLAPSSVSSGSQQHLVDKPSIAEKIKEAFTPGKQNAAGSPVEREIKDAPHVTSMESSMQRGARAERDSDEPMVAMYRPEVSRSRRMEMFTKVSSDDPQTIRKELDATFLKLIRRKNQHERDSLLVGLAFLDTNFQGSVEPEEVRDLPTRMFNRLDTAKDGKISQDELVKGCQTMTDRIAQIQNQINKLHQDKETTLMPRLSALRHDGKLREAEQAEVDLMRLEEQMDSLNNEMQAEQENLGLVYVVFKNAFTLNVFDRIGGSAKEKLEGDTLREYAEFVRKVESFEPFVPARLADAAIVAPPRKVGHAESRQSFSPLSSQRRMEQQHEEPEERAEGEGMLLKEKKSFDLRFRLFLHRLLRCRQELPARSVQASPATARTTATTATAAGAPRHRLLHHLRLQQERSHFPFPCLHSFHSYLHPSLACATRSHGHLTCSSPPLTDKTAAAASLIDDRGSLAKQNSRASRMNL
jgi:Ca2+-binding EF-hand superfamily protein